MSLDLNPSDTGFCQDIKFTIHWRRRLGFRVEERRNQIIVSHGRERRQRQSNWSGEQALIHDV